MTKTNQCKTNVKRIIIMIDDGLGVPQDLFYKCLISGMCFCSAVPCPVSFPLVVSGSPPSLVTNCGTDPKMCTLIQRSNFRGSFS